MDTQSPYTFNQVSGNVEVMQNGQRISTGTASAAEKYGYVSNPVGVAQQMNPDTTAPVPTTAVTPTTISGDKSSTITSNSQKVNDLNAQKTPPVTAFTGGLETYSDGTPINAPTDAIMQSDENGNTWWSSGGKNYALGPDVGLSPEDKQSKDLLEKTKAQTDAAFAQQIAAVQAQYDSLIRQQRDVNARQGASVSQSLLMGGTSRYAGLNAAGIDTAQVSYGIQQVADLQAKENMAIAQLNSAQAEKDYELVGKQLQQIDEIKKKKQEVAKDLNTKLIEANKALRTATETRNNAIDNDIRTAILDAQKGGATPAQIAEMQKALANHDYAGAVSAGGDSLATATGAPGEYNFYKKDALSRGQVPISFDEYQTRDANRKAKIAAAGAQIAAGTDMTIKQQAVFNNIITNQIKSPSMAAVNRTGQLADTTKRIKANPKSAPDQIALIYGVIQILDSYQSAVREGEINLVRDTQGLMQKVNNIYDRVSKGTPIDDKSALAYATLAEQMIDSIKANAEKVNNQFKAQAVINGIGKQYDEYTGTVNQLNQTSPGADIVQSEEQAKNFVDTYISSNPKDAETVAGLYEIPGTTDQDVYDYLKANGKIQ